MVSKATHCLQGDGDDKVVLSWLAVQPSRPAVRPFSGGSQLQE